MKHVIVIVGGPARSGKDTLINKTRTALHDLGDTGMRTDYLSSIDPVKAIMSDFRKRFDLAQADKDSREYAAERDVLAKLKDLLDGRGGIDLTVNLALKHLEGRRPQILFYQVREIQQMQRLRRTARKNGIETLSVFVQRFVASDFTASEYYPQHLDMPAASTDRYEASDVLSFFDVIVNNFELDALGDWAKLIASKTLPLFHK